MLVKSNTISVKTNSLIYNKMDYQEFLKENKKRNEKILELKNKGVSFSDIAKMFNISRQRVEQIVMRMSNAIALDKN